MDQKWSPLITFPHSCLVEGEVCQCRREEEESRQACSSVGALLLWTLLMMLAMARITLRVVCTNISLRGKHWIFYFYDDDDKSSLDLISKQC